MFIDGCFRMAAKAELVKLRFFAGLSLEEIGQALGISRATVERDWQAARAWLFRELSGEEASHDA